MKNLDPNDWWLLYKTARNRITRRLLRRTGRTLALDEIAGTVARAVAVAARFATRRGYDAAAIAAASSETLLVVA